MAYDLVILAVGAGAAIGAILAAVDTSRRPVYYVGLVHRPRKEQTMTEDMAGLAHRGEEYWTGQTATAIHRDSKYAVTAVIRDLDPDRLDYLSARYWWADEPPLLQSTKERRPTVLAEEIEKSVIVRVGQDSRVERHERELQELEKRIRRLEEKAYRTGEEITETLPVEAHSKAIN